MPGILNYNTGGNGLFNKLGAIFFSQQQIVDNITGLRARRDAIAATYDIDEYPWIANTLKQLAAWIDQGIEQLRGYQEDAITTLIEYIHSLIPLPSKTVYEALKVLRDEMLADGQTITGPTGGSFSGSFGITGTAGASNVGNGKALLYGELSVEFGFGIGGIHYYWPPETVTAKCVSSTQNSPNSRIARLEIWRITGKAKLDGMDPDWPGGSGFNVTVPAMQPSVEQQTATGQNVLRNGGFETATADVPNGWELEAGVSGTDFDHLGAADAYSGQGAMRFVSGSTALPEFKQRLDDSSGSIGAILPQRIYVAVAAVNGDVADSVALELRDETGATIHGATLSAQGNGTGWVLRHIMFFPLGTVPDETWAHVIVESNPISANIDADHLIIAPMNPLQSSDGPFVAMIAGSIPAAVGDTFTWSVTNNLDGVFAKWFQRNFDMLALGISIPTGGGTISDALVA